jgi:hypothetical protein
MTPADDLVRRAKMYGCDIRATHESLMLVGDLAAALTERDQRIAALTADLVATQRDYQEARDAHDDKMQLWQAAERRAEAAIPRFWLQDNCYPSELQTVYRLLEAYDAAIAAQDASTNAPAPTAAPASSRPKDRAGRDK